MKSQRKSTGLFTPQLDVFVEFVSSCARIQQYDAFLKLLEMYAYRLLEFERLSILLCDSNRQILRIVVIEDHVSREVWGDEIQLSEMDVILDVLITGKASNRSTCIPMESGGRMAGVLSLVTRVERSEEPEIRFLQFLAGYLAATFERLNLDIAIAASAEGATADTGARESSIAATHSVSLHMSYLAQHDNLTDLPNRLLLNDRLARALASSKRYGRRMAVLFLDLDRFKEINDKLGHAIGDQLLRQISDRMVKCVRSSDTVSRIGGDEFVIVLAELEHIEDAAVGAAKISAAVTAPILIAGQEICISASIGISLYPNDGENAETLIRKADTAMYQSKAEGIGKCVFFAEK